MAYRNLCKRSLRNLLEHAKKDTSKPKHFVTSIWYIFAFVKLELKNISMRIPTEAMSSQLCDI